MSQVFAVIVGGRKDADEVLAFERPILFENTGELMRSYVPDDVVQETFFLKSDAEQEMAHATTLAQTETRYGALSALPKCERVLLIDLPFVSSFDVLKRLLAQNEKTGYDITVMGTSKADLALGGASRCKTPLAAVVSYETLQKLPLDTCNSLGELIEAASNALVIADYLISEGALPIFSGVSCYRAQRLLGIQINERHTENGVQFFDLENTYVSRDAEIGSGTTIMPMCQIRKGCKIGKQSYIGANSILEQATIGDGVNVNQSQIYESTIGNGTTVGPYAYVRPGCEVGEKCRIGDFVEMKKAKIGNGTKVSHLTYIGDAVVGERVNFGCGTVVVNYDGYHKYQTNIGDDCFIGCNTNLVSPVTLGDRVFTAAGTTVTKDVPDGALAVARAKQTTLEGWNDKRRAQNEK